MVDIIEFYNNHPNRGSDGIMKAVRTLKVMEENLDKMRAQSREFLILRVREGVFSAEVAPDKQQEAKELLTRIDGTEERIRILREALLRIGNMIEQVGIQEPLLESVQASYMGMVRTIGAVEKKHSSLLSIAVSNPKSRVYEQRMIEVNRLEEVLDDYHEKYDERIETLKTLEKALISALGEIVEEPVQMTSHVEVESHRGLEGPIHLCGGIRS